ncbi:MAG: L-threonylcarbamoyladenylate synthase [Pseudomonadota bacterium]
MTTTRLSFDMAGVRDAARLINEGALVAFATETVYGLGADARSDAACAAIFEAKGRPRFNPLIVHVTGLEDAQRYGVFSPAALRLAETFWPGPLTLVAPRRDGARLSWLATAGLDTVALRAPAHPAARALLAAADAPIAAPSANRSGAVSPTTADHVLGDLGGRIAAVLDAGPCDVGLESTIIEATGPEPRLLRAGGLARGPIEAVAGSLSGPQPPGAGAPLRPTSPGQLASHYAPQAQMRLNVATPRADEAFLAFGEAPPLPATAAVRNLSDAGDLQEAARRLFADLRALDAAKPASIAVAPIPNEGLGEAINDRLRRAAAPRPVTSADATGRPK